MHPCLIVPTKSLAIKNNDSKATKPISIPLVNVTSPIKVSSSSRVLDEKTGLAILSHVYNSKSLFGEEEEDDYYETNTLSSSFIALPTKKKSTDSSLIQKGKTLFNLYPRADNIHFINKSFLLKHGLNLTILLSECEVEITNLKKAGILSTFDDLLDLDFQMTDLVVNKELFNVGHIVQLFGMNASSLHLSVEDLLDCRFLPAELLTLDFSLADMIESNGIRWGHLKALGYDLESLKLLGFKKAHLKKLKITYPIAVNELRWNPKEVNEMS